MAAFAVVAASPERARAEGTAQLGPEARIQTDTPLRVDVIAAVRQEFYRSLVLSCVATVIDVYRSRKGRFFLLRVPFMYALICGVFLYTTAANMIERPDGLKIAGAPRKVGPEVGPERIDRSDSKPLTYCFYAAIWWARQGSNL